MEMVVQMPGPASFISAPLDDLRSRHVRLLEEASRRGPLTVVLWDDALIGRLTGQAPKFPLAERLYTAMAIRFVDAVEVLHDGSEIDRPPNGAAPGSTWVMEASELNHARRSFAAESGVRLAPISDDVLKNIPSPPTCPVNPRSDRKKVVVTGCFDWLHSGHVRFFEEVSELGDLYVVVGHDANIRLLKGEGHPLFPEAERCYMAGAFRHVTRALVSSGNGWLDGEPEFQKIRPDIYAVNQDGDKPEKQKFCETNGIEYRVLRREPKTGLPRRASTVLRGF
jgi:cytidyltransferase-like protein